MKTHSIDMENYFAVLEKEVKETYEIAKKARSKGYDPEKEVEIPLAKNMAERVEGLISISAPEIINKGIPERIQELEKQFGKLDWRVALSIALEVAQEKFCKFETKIKAIETAIRIGFAYVTVGVVSSPLEGFVKLELKKRIDNQKEYFCLYYSGPVRSAGGTGASVSLLIADYLRKHFNYAKFDPTDKEIKRIVTELYDYHERITNLQYLPSPEEIEFMVSHLPLQIDGDPSEKVEVSNYKDLPRIETNRLRNGVCLVYGECIIQKAPKVFKQLSKWGKDFGLDDWEFMEEFVNLQKKIKSKGIKKEDKEEKVKSDYTFIKDIVAGRPVITYPKYSGGLRLRYGRSRNTGLSATGMHPATMHILNDFIAIGTQLKTERPGKGTTINSTDTIEGPIVKLKNGDVIILDSSEEAKKVAKEVEEILYLGDILISYGDFFNRAHSLMPPGFCEEYWVQLLEEKEKDPEKIAQTTQLDLKRVIELFKNPLEVKPSAYEALILSKSYNIPLHPLYTHRWADITHQELEILLKWLEEKTIKEEKLILPFKITTEERVKSKRVLEKLGIPHKVVTNEYVVVPKEHTLGFRVALGFYNKEWSPVIIDQSKSVLEIINELAEVPIKDKSATIIGARMGRPEKAKVRKLTGSPHGLFPVGEEGGRLRCFQSALEATKVSAEFPLNYCELCKKESIYPKCHICDSLTVPQYWCKECKRQQNEKECKLHGVIPNYKYQELPIKEYYERVKKRLNLTSLPELIKGIRGTSNKEHIPEHLLKAILRSIHNVYVNKDGTIRYDMTELPITHFKPIEVGTPIEKLKQLGYVLDIYDQPLTTEDQILEIKPQDVILPACTEGDEEGADIILFKTAKFVDDLLVQLYQEKPFYNLTSKEDLIGHLVVSLAPHTSAGIVSRIIGFSKTQGFYAHPMLHCAVRRDCVHPETNFLYSDVQGKVYYEQIGGYVEDLLKRGANTKIIDQVGTIAINPSEELYAYGKDPETKKLVKKKIKYFIKGPKNKKWIKITTVTNRELVMTPTHKFMYLDNSNNFKFKDAEKCKQGDKVLVSDYFKPDLIYKNLNLDLIKEFIENTPDEILKKIKVLNSDLFFKGLVSKIKKKKLLESCSLYKSHIINLSNWYKETPLFNIKELIKKDLITYGDLPQNAKLNFIYSPYSFPRFLNINEDVAQLLGYFTAEGHLRTNKTTKQVSFRNSNKNIQDNLKNIVATSFNIKLIVEDDGTKFTISNSLIYYIFKDIFKTGSNAKDKKVPKLLYNCSNSLISRYISAYIEGDGSIVPERKAICLYSKRKELLDEVAFLLNRFNIIGSYYTGKPRIPGKTVLNKYLRQGIIKKFILNHLTFHGKEAHKLGKILYLTHQQKKKKLQLLMGLKIGKRKLKNAPLISFGDAFIDYIKKVEILSTNSNSYCLEVEWVRKEERNIIWGQQIVNTRCDGDEVAIILLLDCLLNFSRKFLPSHRGSTQDAPLVLTSVITPTEVDDMVFDMDVAWKYPLEFYRAAEAYKMPWEVKIEIVKDNLGTEKQFEKFGFTHHTSNINKGVRCSAYKSIPTMGEKVLGQMNLAEKIRAVDTSDVARLVIERHFIRDIKGNLRKFSMQQFRCVNCNKKFRRPPLLGKCTKCKGKLIFTISEGSVTKYLRPSVELAKKYNLPPYLQQTLEITQNRVDSVFGKDKEKQDNLQSWFA